MALNQVLLWHHWSVCIVSMMLGWVQVWVLTDEKIIMHQYKIHHTNKQDDLPSKKITYFTLVLNHYACWEVQFTTVLNF